MLKPGVCLTQALAYGIRLHDEHLPLSSAPAGVDAATTPEGGKEPPDSLDSHVKVLDYPHLRARLLRTLRKYRGTIALPGEPLGSTTLTSHTINIKPGTSPVFIPSLPSPT